MSIKHVEQCSGTNTIITLQDYQILYHGGHVPHRKHFCLHLHFQNPHSLQGYVQVIFTSIFNYIYPTVGFPFAKLLRNFCGTKRKIFLSLRISFARKNNNLRNHSQKSFRAKLPYFVFEKLKFCAILQLEFCTILQFRKNQMVGDGVPCVFLRIQFRKKLVLECLPIGHFYIIDQ